MIYSQNALNILAAKTYKGIGRAWIVKNLKGNESVDFIVFLLNKDAKVDYQITVANFEGVKKRIEAEIMALGSSLDGVVALGDADFPQHRGVVKNSEQPIVLFYKGDIKLLQTDNKNIAVIGLLTPDHDTEVFEGEVVTRLVKSNATIVSGLAHGCDEIAHRQTLLLGGKTVAVLPGPLNAIIPMSNKGLADEIVASGGLLATEYYANAKSDMEMRGRYQERDRLQALFSDGIILSASYAKNDQGNDSGSRLAMEYAASYGIPRAVLYDPIANADNPKYDLSRQLIQEENGIVVLKKDTLVAMVKTLLSHKAESEKKKDNYSQGLLFSMHEAV